MSSAKNWTMRVVDLILYASGDGYRIKNHPGSLSSQTTSAVRPPYKSSIDPTELGKKTQEVDETYHPDFFDGREVRSVIAKKEAARLLSQENSDQEERTKGTRLPQ
jgi:hypothetical protein